MSEPQHDPPPPGRFGVPRSRLVALLVMAAVFVWLSTLVLARPALPDFVAAGTPRALPAAGSLDSADADALAGMLAGQSGRVVVVNIWASWCAPCRAEMPLLQEAAASLGDDVVVLGVAADAEPDDARTFLREVGVRYPNVYDANGSIAAALDVSLYPTTVVFDRIGTVRAVVTGGISEQRLAGLVTDALE